MKSNKSIRNICIAAIKRSVSKPNDFLLTKMFETERLSEILDSPVRLANIDENELPISQTVIDKKNWTLVTTRQIISCIDGATKAASAANVKSSNWNDFKGYSNTSFTIGELETNTGTSIGIFIETGKASMITVHAIMTLVKLTKSGQS